MIADHDSDQPDEVPHDLYADFEAPALRRPRRRRKNRIVRGAIGLAALAVTLVLVIAGGGLAYLGNGPISLESLQPAIADSLQSRLKPGYRVALGPTSIVRGRHGVGIGFTGLAIRDPQGRIVVNAPGGRIGLDAFALLALSIRVRSLELDGLQLALRVDDNGALSLAAGSGEATPIPLGSPPAKGAQVNFGALVAGLAETIAGADQPLNHVAIVDGVLTVQSPGRATPAVYDNLRLSFDRSGASASAGLAAHGPSGEWSLEARAESGAHRKLSIEARQLAADDFLRLNPHPPQFTFDSPISFHFAAEATPAGAMEALDGAFSIGAGSLDLHDPDGSPPIAIDEATGSLALDSQGRIELHKIELLAGATHVRFAGLVSPPTAADPLWRAHLGSNDTLFAGAGPDDPVAKLDKVDFTAHFDPKSKTFETDAFTLAGPHLSGAFGVKAHVGDDGRMALKLDLSGSGGLLEALRLWPTFINPDARKWCLENVHGGELASGSLKVDWDADALDAVLARRAPPAESVDGHFTMRDAKVNLLPGLPMTSGLEATGVITGRHFEVAAQHGTMELGGGRSLAGNDLSFAVPDTAPAPRMAATGAGHVTGGADALAELLSQEALKRYVGVALDPNAIKGQFQGDLKLDLTLGKQVQPEEQKFQVTAALSGLSIDKFLGSSKLEQGALDVAADRNQLKMTGSGQVFGSPAKLEVTKGAQDIGALQITGVLDETARAKLGFNSGPRVKGPITLKLKAPLDKSGADVEVDLAKASIDSLGALPWKTAGKPGKATFQLKAAPEGVLVSNIAVDAGSMSAHGSALFGADGGLKSLKLAPFRMSAGDDLKLDLDGAASPSKLTLRGSTIDVRGFVKGLTASGGSEKDSRDLDLDVKIAAATGYNKEQISGFEMAASRRGGAFAALDARGKLGLGAITAHGGEAGALTVKADDAGTLARFLDLYTKMEGGAMELSLRTAGDTARGVATIRKFTIRNEASLRQLEQSAPVPQNTVRGSNNTFGNDPNPPVRFDKLTANFTRTGGKLDIKDALIANPTFGLTTQGFIDFAKDKVDMNGVYVPLYQFNNALGSIPLLGTLLTGGENEGVFAVNYRVTGAASSPTLNINPFSPLTPGFLRKMFSQFDGTTPSPSGDSPASAYAPTTPSR